MRRLPLNEIRRLIARSLALSPDFHMADLATALGVEATFLVRGNSWIFQIGSQRFLGEDPVKVFTSGLEAVHRQLVTRGWN